MYLILLKTYCIIKQDTWIKYVDVLVHSIIYMRHTFTVHAINISYIQSIKRTVIITIIKGK